MDRSRRRVDAFAGSHSRELEDLGVAFPVEALGYGKNGCVLASHHPGQVVKVTRDVEEIDLIGAIAKIRRGRLPKLSMDQRAELRRIGVTATEVREVRGFARLDSRPRRVGQWFAYRREDVDPLEGDRSYRGERRFDRVDKGVEYWLPDHGPDR